MTRSTRLPLPPTPPSTLAPLAPLVAAALLAWVLPLHAQAASWAPVTQTTGPDLSAGPRLPAGLASVLRPPSRGERRLTVSTVSRPGPGHGAR